MKLSPALKAVLAVGGALALASCDKDEKTSQTIQWDTSALVAKKLDTPVNPVNDIEPVTSQLPISPEHLQTHPELVTWFQLLIDTLWIADTMGVSTLHTDNDFRETTRVVQKYTSLHDIEPLKILAALKTVQVWDHSFSIIHSRKEGTGLSAANILEKVWNHPVTLSLTLYDISSDRPSMKGWNNLTLQLRGKIVVKNGPTYTTNWELEEITSK